MCQTRVQDEAEVSVWGCAYVYVVSEEGRGPKRTDWRGGCALFWLGSGGGRGPAPHTLLQGFPVVAVWTSGLAT